MKKIIAALFSVIMAMVILQFSAKADEGITNQPEDVTTLTGRPIQFSVQTDLPNPTYQWQYSKDGGSTWVNSPSAGNKKATVTVNAIASMNGRVYRCLITSEDVQLETRHALLTVKGIQTQPSVQKVIDGENAVFRVVTTVAGASYQWQYSKDDGETWVNSSSSGNNTATVSLNTDVGMHGHLYRCLVTYDDTVLESKSVKLTVKGIKTQPSSYTAYMDEMKTEQYLSASFSIDTTVSGASYQWQYSEDGGVTWKNAPSQGATTKKVTIRLVYSVWKKGGRLYRCLVTYGDTVLISEPASLTFSSITKDYRWDYYPTFDQYVLNGEQAFLTVETNVPVDSYQWQYLTYPQGMAVWVDCDSLGNKTDTLIIIAEASKSRRCYRCKVTYNGITAISGSIILHVGKIAKQPISQTVTAGNPTSFIAKVNVVSVPSVYQWQYSTDGGVTWKNSIAPNAHKAKVTVHPTAEYDGRLYRCLISLEGSDYYLITDAALLTVFGIRIQPEDQSVQTGNSASFSIETSGPEATYQWQYSKDGGSTWVNSPSSGNKTATVTINTNAGMNGRLYRCLVTYGDTVLTSNTAKLTIE